MDYAKALREDQWDRIKDSLPGKASDVAKRLGISVPDARSGPMPWTEILGCSVESSAVY